MVIETILNYLKAKGYEAYFVDSNLFSQVDTKYIHIKNHSYYVNILFNEPDFVFPNEQVILLSDPEFFQKLDEICRIKLNVY